MKVKAVTLLVVISACSIGTGALLWYAGDRVIVRILSAVVGTSLIALSSMARRFFVRYVRLIQLSGMGLGILLWMGNVFLPTVTDRGSSWNEAVRAARVLQSLSSKNAEYAAVHQGSFASSLGQLGLGASVGRSYTLTYRPVSDQNDIVRHYTVEAAPQGTYWISLFADETGVVRFSDVGPAGRDSPPIF